MSDALRLYARLGFRECAAVLSQPDARRGLHERSRSEDVLASPCILTPADSQAIERASRALERAIGVEVVTIVVGKCDVYPEIVWKAFALGASLAALVVVVGDVVRPDWVTSARDR